MKKSLLLCLLSAVLSSCSTTISPKETAVQFVKALHEADFTTASSLTSKGTNDVLEKANKEQKATMTAEEAFQLSALLESASGNQAEVKNNLLTLLLVKEEGEWKVALDEALLREIQGREAVLANLQAQWQGLQKEYEGRTTIAKEYINYKKSQGGLSTPAKALEDALANLLPEKAWTKETLLAYTQKQQALAKTIDNTLEPSLAANTDLTMSYFMQLNTAGERTKVAEGAYQAAAEKAQSATFVPLPAQAVGTLQVQHN